jgi:hypothetical protein
MTAVCKLPDMAKATDTLADAIERFDSQVTKAAARPTLRRRLARRPLPARPVPAHRPTRHPAAVPVRYRRAAAPTVPRRLRAREERRTGGNRVTAAVRRGAGRVRDAVRNSLLAVRRGLRRLGGRPERAS